MRRLARLRHLTGAASKVNGKPYNGIAMATHHDKVQFAPIALSTAEYRVALSTSTAKAGFKGHLRELYKKVHPDLFHDQPEAREANEKSFKLLQEYIAVSKEGGSFAGIAGVPYRFEFYLRKDLQRQTSSTTADPKKEAAGSIERVALTLPPPGRLGSHGTASEQLPPSAERGLGRLLAACGLHNPWEDKSGFSRTPQHTFSAEQLRNFVPEAAELLRQNEAAHFGPKQHLSAARTALRLGRQVSAEFTNDARKLAVPKKAELLQRLAKALDKVPENVSGLHFLVGHGYGMDSQGRVRLHASDNALMWSGFLLQLDLDGCRKRQAAVQGVRQLENAVATSIGVPVIFSGPQLTLLPEYRTFLEGLAAASRREGPIFPTSSVGISLRVTGPEGSSSGEEDFAVDLENCILSVPVFAPPDRVYSFCKAVEKRGVQENVSTLLKSQRERQEASRELDSLRHQTECRLRLRKLAFDPSVPPDQLRACCLRLNQASDTLKGVFDGLPIRISHTNQVRSDSSCIEIAWNFEV